MNKMFQPLSTEAQWHSLLNEAQTRSHQHLSEMLEHYLVMLLMRFTHRAESLCQAVAPNYLQAMSAEGQKRPRGLRDVGDTCLLLSGLFPGRTQALAVNTDYYIGLGQSAYGEAANHLDTDDHPLFLTLAQSFIKAMDVLMAIRLINHNEAVLPDPLSAYELKQAHNSESAKAALHQYFDDPDSVIIDLQQPSSLH